jgi:hypothetical protein
LNVQIGAHEGEVVESNVNGINFKVILFRKWK